MEKKVALGIMLTLMLIGMFSGVKSSLGHVPTMDFPIFELLNLQKTQVIGGVDFEFALKNIGFPATTGTVWIPWEEVMYTAPLEGSPPSGNIPEAALELDVNGDDDESDVFNVNYINDTQVEVNGAIANAMRIPSQIFPFSEGELSVREKYSFTLGTKTHVLYNAGDTFASFGLDSFFRDHPSPNIEVVIYHRCSSRNDSPTAEVASLSLNGSLIPYEFNVKEHELNGVTGRWNAYNVFVYPLGFLNSNDISNIRLSIRGEPGSYMLTLILNWAPDTLHRYQYMIYSIFDMSFTIGYVPGVKTGDWARYNGTVDWTGTPDPSLQIWCETKWGLIEVTDVSGTVITFTGRLHFKNGSEQVVKGVKWDIAPTGSFGLMPWFIGSSLQLGDKIYPSSLWTINETVTRIYNKVSRENNHLNVSTTYPLTPTYETYSLDCYWDKTTGIITEQCLLMNSEDPPRNFSIWFKMIDTNMWGTRSFDLNLDGKVDGKDIAIIAKAFGTSPNDPRWNPLADLTQDNKIEGKDLAKLARNFGKIYP